MADKRYVGFKEEATFGTEATGSVIDITDGMASAGLANPDDPNIPIPTLGRFQGGHIPGFYSPSGPLEFSLDVNSIGWFLKWGLGGYTYTAGSSPTMDTHEFYATTGNELKSATYRIGKDTFEHVILGGTINKMNLSIEDGLATVKPDIIAKTDKETTLRTTLNTQDPDLFPLAFYNVETTLNGVDVSQWVKSWSWDYENGIKAENGQGQGSRHPYRLRANGGKTSLSLKMVDDTSDYLEMYWGDEAGPTTAQHTPFAVTSVFDSADFGQMTVSFPKCYFSKVPTDIKGSDERIPEYTIQPEATTITLKDTITTVTSPVLITLENFLDEYKLPP